MDKEWGMQKGLDSDLLEQRGEEVKKARKAQRQAVENARKKTGYDNLSPEQVKAIARHISERKSLEENIQ